MKAIRILAVSTVALGGVAAFGLYSGSGSAQAHQQTQQTVDEARAAREASAARIPRHPGRFDGGSISSLTYVPSCPAYVIDMDATAIQESENRAFVQAEAARFETIREKWDAYEDCLVENARRDIDAVRDVLSQRLSEQSNADAVAYNAAAAAAQANVERVSKLPPPKAPPRRRGNDQAATAEPAAGVAISTWTKPEGRITGRLSGVGDAPVYESGCPAVSTPATVSAFGSAGTRESFNQLVSELQAAVARVNDVRACRLENGQADFEDAQQAVQRGYEATLVPAKEAFERAYVSVRFQLNQHRAPGGLLAPPEMSRPPARPPAKSKSKKK